MNNLIGISSQKRMGKDLLADLISEYIEVQKTAFADGIKDSFCELFDVTKEWIEEWKENSAVPPGWNMNVRSSMQFIGDGFREMKSDIWITQAIKKVKNFQGNSIISDERYLNEMSATKEIGGKIIILYRPGFLNTSNHPSEAIVRPILEWFVNNNYPEGFVKNVSEDAPPGTNMMDLYLINNGTVEDLRSKVKKFVINGLYNI